MTIEMRCLDCLDMLPTLADRLPKLEAEFQQAAEAHAILAADKDEFDDPRNPTALAAAHQARKELDGPCGRLRRLCDQGLHTFTPPPGQVADYVGVAGAIITNPKCQACDGVRFAYYVSDDERPHLEAMLKADRYFPVPAEIHDGPAPCPRCGAHKGYAVSRTVEIGGESDERRDQIMMQCNGCCAAFEVEDVEPRVLN